ncbi:hypothetical protein [Spiroplasma endosymbiont of Nebria brevicollis]|uniref:hypothetical protein n=1 Tax=Spiroplasma endosymbiont of Nebria brevicollis TaxID=3066284 RepID=UPI00313EA0B1
MHKLERKKLIVELLETNGFIKISDLYKNKKLKNGLLPTCTCGGKNELKWIQQNISNWKTMSCIYSKFETKQMY